MMEERLNELLEYHKTNLENLIAITDYSVRCLYESLVEDIIEISKEEL